MNHWLIKHRSWLLPTAVFGGIFLAYLIGLARTPVLGDPTEYTFVAHILGIAHPPGYAFITLLGNLFQTLIPVGSVAWRMHLLAAVAALLAGLFVYGSVVAATAVWEANRSLRQLAGLFAGLSVLTAVNHWQHGIHANPHIITGAFLVANLYFLTKWWAAQENTGAGYAHPDKWLLIFCLSAGLGVGHHPLTVFGFVGYTATIVAIRPSIFKQGRLLLKMVLLALLGLTVWLYFPIRSPMAPGFGPTTMNTLNGFLDHVLARGLSESLPYYGLADQPHRQLVFWSLLRLQYTLPTLILALFGWGWLLRQAIQQRRTRPSARPAFWPLLILYTLPVLGVYAFVISLKAQDIMAYLIGPFAVVGLWSGLGLFGVGQALRHRTAPRWALGLLLALFFMAGPVYQLVRNAPLVSLADYREGQDYVDAVFNQFSGQGQGAVLLNDWEHMTPLWYAQWVDGRSPNSADIRPELISTGGANPWLEGIFNYLPGGPVYLSNFRPHAIAGTEFRLRPSGPFYQVVEPGDATLPPTLQSAALSGGEAELVGYEWADTAVTAGDFVPLTLALRTPNGTADYYVPVVQVGNLTYEFTTDSHLISPNWWPGEVIIERFDLALPHDLAAGAYPVTVQLKNLSQDVLYPEQAALGTLTVAAAANPPDTEGLLANFRQRVGLVQAVVVANGRMHRAIWTEEAAVQAQPGDTLHLILEWVSLAKAEESYTIFVHLIDGANTPHVALDYTPLGGAAPTHLWIPKWLPGQHYLDPYRMVIPEDLAPGTYWIEVGLYEMVNGRRLHISDEEGNLNGDRFILGPVVVE